MLPVQAWDGCSSRPRGKSALPSLLSVCYPLSLAALQVRSEDNSNFKVLLCLSICQTNIGLPSFCFLLQPPPPAPLLSHCPLLSRMLKVCVHAQAWLYTIFISFRLLLSCTWPMFWDGVCPRCTLFRAQPGLIWAHGTRVPGLLLRWFWHWCWSWKKWWHGLLVQLCLKMCAWIWNGMQPPSAGAPQCCWGTGLPSASAEPALPSLKTGGHCVLREGGGEKRKQTAAVAHLSLL